MNKNRKAIRRARRIRRTVLTVCLMALVAVLSIGGTIAWLTSTPEAITNTFTVGDVTITLAETKGEGTTATAKSFKMVPGNEIEKDPKVTVVSGSEACYVFVKVTKENDPDIYLTYSIDSAWTELDATQYPGVYYKDVDAATATAGATYSVLTGDKVTVKAVTDAQMVTAGTNNPKLTFKAYAIQKANTGTAAEAWTKLVSEIGE